METGFLRDSAIRRSLIRPRSGQLISLIAVSLIQASAIPPSSAEETPLAPTSKTTTAKRNDATSLQSMLGVTAAAFGDIYDLSDGAKPIKKGGGYNDIVSGDSWYSTWAGDGTAYLIHCDGQGFDNVDGLNARTRLCRLEGDPNQSTADFRGVNLNPGILGNTMPNGRCTPEGQFGYASTVYEQDGTIYIIRYHWSNYYPVFWPPVFSSFTKSTDGGRNWVDHLGRTNAPLIGTDYIVPAAWLRALGKTNSPIPRAAPQPVFEKLPWSWLTFIQYGKGGAFPQADNADRYVYLSGLGNLIRVPRDRLAAMNRKDFQFYKGQGQDGMLDSSWANEPVGSNAMVSMCNVMYNFDLGCYIGTSGNAYCEPGKQGVMDAMKCRFSIYAAPHPWGPWRRLVNYGIWGRAGWNLLLCNKFTAPGGRKMLLGFSGEFLGDVWNYGLQYTPVYLSTGQVDTYEADKATLQGPALATNYPDHSGAGYVAFNRAGDTATFAIDNINSSGWHIVRLRYTAPTAEQGGNTLSVHVNGRKARRVRLSLNNCDYQPEGNWIDRSDIYYLKHGANTFEVRQEDGDTGRGVFLDYIAVSREPTHDEGLNIAPNAAASASSGTAANANKGWVDDGLREWIAGGAKDEWIKFDWGTKTQNVSKVVLYDLASMKDQVTSGTLTFSDGSSLPVGKLQNDGQAGTIVTFPPRKINWLKFSVGAVRQGTSTAGLGEIEIYTQDHRP